MGFLRLILGRLCQKIFGKILKEIIPTEYIRGGIFKRISRGGPGRTSGDF